jgi:hypothetical protein
MLVVAISLATENLATRVRDVRAVKMVQKKKVKHASLAVKGKKLVVVLPLLLHQICRSVHVQNV